MRTLIISLLTLFFAAGTTFAAPRLDPSQAQFDHGPAMMPIRSVSDSADTETEGAVASDGTQTWPGMHREDGRPGMWQSSSTDQRDGWDAREAGQGMIPRGLLGTVTNIASSSFAMTLQPIRGQATTTFTVIVTSSTKFLHASTTASFSDVTVGERVDVIGKISSSTASVLAERVAITSSTRVPDTAPKPSIFTRIKNMLFGTHVSNTSTEGGPAAVAASGGMFGSFLHALVNLF